MLYTQNKKENLEAYNRIGIDTIRWVVPLKSFHKWLLKNNYIQLSSNINLNKQIELVEYDKSVKGKLSKKENTQEILYKIKNTNNRNSINSFIVAKHTVEAISKSKEAKKNPNYYIEISINGLHQPHKEISSNTYHFISKLIKRYKIHSLDLACDNTFNKYHLLSLKESLKPYGFIKVFETSIYINSPKLNNNISKLIIYNKAKKHNLDIKWTRIEATILINSKIKKISDLDIKEEVDFLYLMNGDIFKKENNLNQNKLNTQVKVISDLRTVSKENNKYKAILKLNSPQKTQAKNDNQFAINKAYIKSNKNRAISLTMDRATTYQIKRPLVYSVYTIRNLNNSNKIRVASDNHRNKKIGTKKHSLPYIKRKFKIVFNI